MSSDDNHDDKELPTPLSVQQIEDFWREFVRHQKELKTLSDHDFVNRTNEILQPFAPDLALEHERSKDSDTSLLVVPAHGNIDQFENIQAMARHAPQMPGYKVQAFRSRALGSDFSMGMDGFTLACSDVLVAHYDAGGNVGLLVDELLGQRNLTDADRAGAEGEADAGLARFVTENINLGAARLGRFSMVELTHAPEFQHAAI